MVRALAFPPVCRARKARKVPQQKMRNSRLLMLKLLKLLIPEPGRVGQDALSAVQVIAE
jgi:hypothetical protein